MRLNRPDDLFDRVEAWDELAGFATSRAPGLRLAIVSGRRRQGKSFLLRRLVHAGGGLYHQAQEVQRTQALARFAEDVAAALGLGRGQLRFGDWETALRAALGYPERGSTDLPTKVPPELRRLLVIDELPYLLAHSPEIPSVIQELYDEARDGRMALSAAVIMCGSALSGMNELLSGTKPLRGRAQLEMKLLPFDYRTAADYWGITDPGVAFQVDAVLGGTAGYKSLIAKPPPARVADLPHWLGTCVLNPSHALFGETDYLLREDPRITDKTQYNSILSAVAEGRHAPRDIGALVGRDYNHLRHPLGVLESSGFLGKVEDVLTQKRPLFFITDPIVRFAEVVVEPNRTLLEERDIATAWSRAAPSYSSQVLGPHFEQMALVWTQRYSGSRWAVELGEVGPAVINDREGKAQHQLDVVALARGSRRYDRRARVAVIGEAKSTNRARTEADLARLEKIRDALARGGLDVTSAHLALFSRDGFDKNVARIAAARADVHLVDLKTLYSS